MKKPILIVNVPNNNPDEKLRREMEEAILSNKAFEDFEIAVFWGCEASIYYPPKENQNELQPKS